MSGRVEIIASLPVSAASGLVATDQHFYVVADDELTLLRLARHDLGAYELIVLRGGRLPREPKARKAEKPDFEALALIGERLIAWPSGSTDKRHLGAWMTTRLGGGAKVFDATALHAAIAQSFAAPLNIEGAAVRGDELILFQRGNAKHGVDGIACIDLPAFERALDGGAPLTASMLRRTARVDLGDLYGVRLGFTDAAPLGDGRLVFVAAAEATDHPYDDAAVAGSAIGVLGTDDRVQRIVRLQVKDKVEGVTVVDEGGTRTAYMVTDADDPARAASLLRIDLASLGS